MTSSTGSGNNDATSLHIPDISVRELLKQPPEEYLRHYYSNVRSALHPWDTNSVSRAFKPPIFEWRHLSPFLNSYGALKLEFRVQMMKHIQDSVVGSDVAEGFVVCPDVGNGKGKGLVAARQWHRDDEILRERPYVAVQSVESRRENSHRYFTEISNVVCLDSARFNRSVELQVAWRILTKVQQEQQSGSLAEASEESRVLEGYAHDLMSGELKLPFPHLTCLPLAVFCPGGCGALYCSSRCCAEAWMLGHCLLCPGAPTGAQKLLVASLPPHCPYVRPFSPRELRRFQHDRNVFGWMDDFLPPPPAEVTKGATRGLLGVEWEFDDPRSPVATAPLPTPPWITSESNPHACRQLVQYSEQLEMPTITLVSQIIANVLCVTQQLVWIFRHGDHGCGLVGNAAAASMAHAQLLLGPLGSRGRDPDLVFRACFWGAWMPMAAASKRPLVECTSPSDGVTREDYDRHVRAVVKNCSRLCNGSIEDGRAEAMFSPSVISHVLGAFELNCLGITVESPIEDLVEEITSSHRRAASSTDLGFIKTLNDANLILSSVGVTDVPCDGSAFYPLQSCLNHDNDPNCSCQKDIDDRDGCAVLTALRKIEHGEELTISYIGDVELQKSEEIRALLDEYGIPA